MIGDMVSETKSKINLVDLAGSERGKKFFLNFL